MTFTQLILVAVLCEALWETLKLVWQTNKISVDRVGALVLGVAIALLTGIDFFEMVGLPVNVPVVGPILTGILLSRGANFAHDIIGTVTGLFKASKSDFE